MKDLLATGLEAAAGAGRSKAFLRHFDVQVPTLTVVTTDRFEAFMAENRLWDVVHAGEPDHRIALAFQAANLPVELLGDLYALTRQVHTPLAVRSSSLLEDALNQPFAGVYATKMIPNNQHDVETRFHKLVEAVKFVYASTFFENARNYRRLTGHKEEDRMAVILQAIVGRRYRDRFYPELSGVARSYSFYRSGNTRPEDGVVNLAFGLGKTIVDGGITWSCSPAYPARHAALRVGPRPAAPDAGPVLGGEHGQAARLRPGRRGRVPRAVARGRRRGGRHAATGRVHLRRRGRTACRWAWASAARARSTSRRCWCSRNTR